MTESDRNFRDWKCDDTHEGVHCFARATWLHERINEDGKGSTVTAHVCHDHLPIKAVRGQSEAALGRLLKGESP